MKWFRKPEPKDWTCMVCGDWRDDKHISVYMHTHTLYPSATRMKYNVRYCNDRQFCYDAARIMKGPIK